ncbi:protein involved in biosynthesis of mitomycin antibiotics/polyketide fumonisin [Capsulimonas corticalis]|uniref:Protein involved in biosynthesis of mitomycin antibiotics/polyketide fumonisin n=1 Tax=Capsulimonas corticalis TaxID=2219043 RepID=A0A402CV89_9BACT|nr:phytanoyl-CoA dioxygenase family protein [Capsulimonas corticalis]BDI30351.1 protein involved in biosynthesis of mitomycin antibiotics/polyketide fumonisin [Capsulimonas corticalis]
MNGMGQLDGEAKARYERDGFLVVPALFNDEEVASLREHYMELRAAGTYPGDFGGVDLTSSDPLKRFPRMIHMHRWDETSLRWLLDARLNNVLTQLLGVEPLAVQTMLYFKPAGARGQALHQDNFYLRVQPGTCMAAWLALDPCDEANGCMQAVPGSHALPLLCPQRADTTLSFTDVTVPVPAQTPPAPILMAAGDVLFFNGSLIHGSFPNTTPDRFRRSLISHYIAGNAEQVGAFYHPALRMDGSTVELDASADGAPCGVWRDIDGQPTVEMVDEGLAATAGHE